ncbi:MAG: heparinase II/III family protein, partial [Prevotella sp.]
NRTRYEKLYFERRTRLAMLVMAEVMEGHGRFMPDIIDGLHATLEETWWGLPAHYKTMLPAAADQTVDLFNAETAGLMAWTAYVLATQLDEFSPLLRKRMESEIARRMIQPALKHNYWWKKAGMNWNPWICSNWLACVLLCDSDKDRRLEALKQIAAALDAFVAAYPADGGCDEGTDYWDRAAASLFDCLHLLRLASQGRIDMSGNGKIRAMGSYIYKMYIGNGYCVNFADAHHNRMQLQVNVAYPFGLYLGDATMKAFAAHAARQQNMPDSASAIYRRSGNSPVLGRELLMLKDIRRLLDEKPSEPRQTDVWLPDLQIMTARRGNLYVAAKGGHNGESHNHNDVGSFIVYADGKPLLVDPGVGEYTARTFGNGRYDIWTMQSAYHNLPLINGQAQKDGKEHGAKAVAYRRGSLKLDIAGAYPDMAGVERWTREVKMTAAAVEITEDYRLKHISEPVRLMLVTPIEPDLSVAGEIGLDGHAVIYDKRVLEAGVEDISSQLDSLLKGLWGEHFYRIVLTVRQPSTAGIVRYKVK